MSFSIDAVVLLHASDNASSWNRPARRFLEHASAGPEPVVLAWPVLMKYLRISTHSRVFSRPLTSKQAESNVDALLTLPHVKAVGEGEGFWERYRSTVSSFPTRGSDVADAHFVALLAQHGVRTLYTRDADFSRFPDVRVRDPYAAHWAD